MDESLARVILFEIQNRLEMLLEPVISESRTKQKSLEPVKSESRLKTTKVSIRWMCGTETSKLPVNARTTFWPQNDNQPTDSSQS